jgi:hypothetical protein
MDLAVEVVNDILSPLTGKTLIALDPLQHIVLNVGNV